jgi:hypothetical protein
MSASGHRTKYVTIVQHVKEVSLYGRADLDYWRGRLLREGLAPLDDQGCAEVLLIAADMVWMGQRFSELSVSVSVARAGNQRDGMYMIQAFNSLRAFAWVERTFFQTPYYRARTHVSVEAPVALALTVDGRAALSATLAGDTPRAGGGPETFSGPVYLPGALTRTPRAEKVFYAELSGETLVHPFGPNDRVVLAPNPRATVVQSLKESGFAGREWHIRPDGVHKKSQTMRPD